LGYDPNPILNAGGSERELKMSLPWLKIRYWEDYIQIAFKTDPVT